MSTPALPWRAIALGSVPVAAALAVVLAAVYLLSHRRPFAPRGAPYGAWDFAGGRLAAVPSGAAEWLLTGFGLALAVASSFAAHLDPGRAAGWRAFGDDAFAMAVALAALRVVTLRRSAASSEEDDEGGEDEAPPAADAPGAEQVLAALHPALTVAVLKAERLYDARDPGAAAAYARLSALEQSAASLLPADDLGGAIARVGAVRAAMLAGDAPRAAALAALYEADPSLHEERRREMREFLRAGVPARPGGPGA